MLDDHQPLLPPRTEAMKARYELIATIAEWKGANGKACKRTSRVGTVFESPNGRLSMKLEMLPLIPGWSGFIAFRDLREEQEPIDPPDP